MYSMCYLWNFGQHLYQNCNKDYLFMLSKLFTCRSLIHKKG